METYLIRYNIGIIFEYTPRSTAQNNFVVERKYQTLYNLMRDILNE